MASSMIQTGGTQKLAKETGHRAPVPTEVMAHLYSPFAPGVVLDPFMGGGTTIVEALRLGCKVIGRISHEDYLYVGMLP